MITSNVVPFDPRKTPRRSSLKGGSVSKSLSSSDVALGSTPRRASIGAFSSYDLLDLEILKEVDPDSVLEVQLPGRRRSVTRRRSITFNDDVKVRSIQPAKNLTDKPARDLWFQDDEYDTMDRKNR